MKDNVIGVTIAAGTGTTGLAQMLGMIPDDIGKLAVLFGIIATISMTVYNILKARKESFETEKLKIEIEIMRADLK